MQKPKRTRKPSATLTELLAKQEQQQQRKEARDKWQAEVKERSAETRRVPRLDALGAFVALAAVGGFKRVTNA